MAKEPLKSTQSKKITRDELLETSSWLVNTVKGRLDVTRFKEQDADNTRLAYLRLLATAITSHNNVLKDNEIEELKDRIECMELAMGDRNEHIKKRN